MPLLSATEIHDALAALPGWRLDKDTLLREFTFEDFREAMSFVNHVAVVAESNMHHPDIDIRYNRVCLALTTHDADGVTGKDIALARAIANIL